MKKRTIMGIFAHPDDDTFGPGGTFAKYASLGHNIHVLTATSGQAGQAAGLVIDTELQEVRKVEWKKSLDILGVKSSTMLSFYDGTLNESQIPVLQQFIIHEVNKIKPDVIIIFERDGISMHLDHIAVTKAVTLLFDNGLIKPQKIYYFGMPEALMQFFFREGGLRGNNLTQIDTKDFFEIKTKAMKAHRSQMKDWRRILGHLETAKKQGKDFSKTEYFQLARTTLKEVKYPETDLLQGLK